MLVSVIGESVDSGTFEIFTLTSITQVFLSNSGNLHTVAT